jgi:DnaJ-class molecular chaperone
MKDYYAILEVKADASYADIKTAWRDKARQWHPDKFLSDDEKLAAHKQFVEILEAYSILIDEKKRAAYDRGLAAGVAGTYAGYENATPAQDQQEAADWFQRILNETPSEFAQTTILILIMFR